MVLRRRAAFLLLVILMFSRSAGAEQTEYGGVQALSLSAAGKAAQIAASMDLESLASQVILTAVDGRVMRKGMAAFLAGLRPGGVMLFRGNVSASDEQNAQFIAAICRYAAGKSGIVPFIASDQEGGAVQRFRGSAALPSPLSYRKKFLAGNNVFPLISADAERAGRALRTLGITLNLAPLAEITWGGSEFFLGERSYGPDKDFNAKAAAAFVSGMKKADVAAVLKHFPGNSAADPHRRRALLDADSGDLETLILPFRTCIAESNPAAVMLSHVVVGAWDTVPASLSRKTVEVLRRDLGFGGVIIADDFSMKAAGDRQEVCAVKALEAGVDMVMAWPSSAYLIRRSITEAARSGCLSEDRLRDAVCRILTQKIRYGLIP